MCIGDNAEFTIGYSVQTEIMYKRKLISSNPEDVFIGWMYPSKKYHFKLLDSGLGLEKAPLLQYQVHGIPYVALVMASG